MFNVIKKILSNETLKDVIIIMILTTIYSIMSFINLGSFKNPQTFCRIEPGEEILFELAEEVYISKIRYYVGNEICNYTIYTSDNNGDTQAGQMPGEWAFGWKDYTINRKCKFFTIKPEGKGSLGEIQVYDKNSKKVDVKATSYNANLLIDEPNSVPEEISYQNTTYFDEIYFARSAYEHVNGIPAMEWTHPPLGKIIQSLPIRILGMTPFAYRLMGNIAGIGIVVVMYIFGKELFKKRIYAFLPAFLMAFDNFHFAQTRIGTSDSFLVLFCMLACLFMYKYSILKLEDSLKKKIKYLFLCGLFWGLAVSVKWSAIYVGLGLAIIFFGKLAYESIKNKKIDKQYLPIILYCILFFIVIPCLIYTTCYMIFPTVYGKVTNLSELVEQTKGMFKYHSELTATHSFSSEWYTWPLMIKPVWFYVSNTDDGLYSTISAIGNPAVWWLGALAVVFVLISSIGKREKENIFIAIMYLSAYLPYVFIGRVMFLYHYFIALPFVMLATTSLLKFFCDKLKKEWLIIGYIVIVFILFWVFYPVSSGMPVQKEYAESLKWLSTWIF